MGGVDRAGVPPPPAPQQRPAPRDGGGAANDAGGSGPPPRADDAAPAALTAAEAASALVPEGGAPVQIVQVVGNKLQLDEAAMLAVMARAPADMKVAVVSVVGAFRTGKSFLLDLLLRYLQHDERTSATLVTGADGGGGDGGGGGGGGGGGEGDAHDVAPPSPEAEGWEHIDAKPPCAVPAPPPTAPSSRSRNGDADAAWLFEGAGCVPGALVAGTKATRAGFAWRGGRDRETTGIWMWSHPFVRELPGRHGESVAVFLMDTQGMFDSETSQMLTASIFGLSALISSYQIYNVVRQIQEDNLQHLALFAEYGRVAFREANDAGGGGERVFPFQTLEFLVRDAIMDVEDLDALGRDKMIADMQKYVADKMGCGAHADMRQIREQVRECFAEFGCFTLPHPGVDVAEKKTYSGDIGGIRMEFRQFVDVYFDRIFHERLAPKSLLGRDITAAELGDCILRCARPRCP